MNGCVRNWIQSWEVQTSGSTMPTMIIISSNVYEVWCSDTNEGRCQVFKFLLSNGNLVNRYKFDYNTTKDRVPTRKIALQNY